jgi:3-deoxy-manno-octulosonate cytidylyltransferase (CMP-KDO synthetase)
MITDPNRSTDAQDRDAQRERELAARRVATVVIPARLGSTRFPGKVLAADTGRPMIAHVYQAAINSKAVHRVVVATDDKRVLQAVRDFGGEAVMTSPRHENGTSRIAEAADILGLPNDEIVVNAQGDEPELESTLVSATVRALVLSGAAMSTVACPFAPGDDLEDRNVVKVVRRLDGAALYFSRGPIPTDRDRDAPPEAQPLRHVGLYAYRAGFLRKYAKLAPTPLERAEKLEQLRALEHGYAIAVAVRAVRLFGGIDTPEQYKAFVARWKARRGVPIADTDGD